MARRGRETDKAASAATLREARLKAALKENLARRKAQARAKVQGRAAEPGSQQPDEPGEKA